MHDILLLLLARATTLSLYLILILHGLLGRRSFRTKTKQTKIENSIYLATAKYRKNSSIWWCVYICGGGGSVVTFRPPVRVRSAQNQGGLLLFTFVVLLCFAFFFLLGRFARVAFRLCLCR